MARITLIALSLLLFVASCSAASPTDEEMAVVIQQGCGQGTNFSQFLPKMDIDNPAKLPCSRPAPYDYIRNFTMYVVNGTRLVRPPIVPNQPYATAIKDLTKGNATISKIRHAPIKGVNTTMVKWMWENMDKTVADPRDGKKWQMFQLMHPSDHVGVTWNTKKLIVPPFPGEAPGNATKWMWTEIPASGCKVNTTHVTCPEKQPGYTCNSTTAEQLKKVATFNVSMVASEVSSDVDESGYEIAAITMRYFFNVRDAGCVGTDLWRPFVEFRSVMYYQRGAPQMRVVTTWTAGYPSSIANIFNEPFLMPLWAGFTPGGKQWRLAANYYIMHMLQEWAALPLWLPKVWEANKDKQL